MLRIVTDGAADMPESWKEEYDIQVIPLTVRFGEESFLQGRDIGVDNFYRLVQQKRVFPKTSLPSPGQIADFYRQIARQGDTILSIHLASKMSGTFSAVQMGAREVMNEFRIFTMDSGAGSAALGFMCRDARLMERAGASVDEIHAWLEQKSRRLAIAFTLDTLDYAYLSGRIGKMTRALSSMLRIKPIIILRDGLLSMSEKVRTRHNALERVVNVIRERVGEMKVNVAVVHAADLEAANDMVQRLRGKLNLNEVVITDLSIPVAANLGPGTIGIVAYPVHVE